MNIRHKRAAASPRSAMSFETYSRVGARCIGGVSVWSRQKNWIILLELRKKITAFFYGEQDFQVCFPGKLQGFPGDDCFAHKGGDAAAGGFPDGLDIDPATGEQRGTLQVIT